MSWNLRYLGFQLIASPMTGQAQNQPDRTRMIATDPKWIWACERRFRNER